MTNENYGKCKTCRFCIRSGDVWKCVFTGSDSGPEGSCGRFRPGICESCSFYSVKDGREYCGAFSKETYALDVCSFYDPSSRTVPGSAGFQ
ncbi:MAG: hypothetical protein ACOX8L_03985 [Candidatus Methanomethylophilaceae archaeon]